VHVSGPDYVSVWVSVGFDALSGREIAPVQEAVKAAVRTFLSALRGGVGEDGWPLATTVERLELWARATRVEGVAKVNEVYLTDDSGVALDRVDMTGLRLPRLVAVVARPGDPQPLDDLRGDAPGPPPLVLPIPVEPSLC
jgi:hypothetical protein